jgi:hypothetical protein
MQEFIIDETQKIFCKSIKRYANDLKKENQEISIMLYIKQDGEEEGEVGYNICVNNNPVQSVTIKDVLNVKFDIKGYSLIVPPYIKQFLNDFEKQLNSTTIDVCVYLSKEDEDECRFFLFNAGKFVNEVYLTELIKI